MSENVRSGYEIREGLLGLAKDICEQNAHMRFEQTNKKDWSGVTTEDVIREAEKLYQFVQNKG